MKIKLEKDLELSGDKASIYVISKNNEADSLLDLFYQENESLFINELNAIGKRLFEIGNKYGAREQFFRINEGKPGDGVCALYDEEESNLRLYCIRYGSLLVIVGGGGPKSKDIKAFQEDTKLTYENKILRELSKEISIRTKGGDIKFINDGMDFDGDLEFEF